MVTEPKYVTVTEAAKRRQIHPCTVRRMASEIPGAVKVGRGWIIPEKSVDSIPKRERGERGKGKIPPGEILPGVALCRAPCKEGEIEGPNAG